MSKDFENNNEQEPKNFGLPEGYFQNSADSIFNKIEWLEEHKAYPVLSSLKGKSGFTIPENYFQKTECRLELLDSPVLSSAKKETGFTLPLNYFDEAEIKNLSLAFDESAPVNFEILNSIPKVNPFSVTGEYFNKNEAELIKKLSDDKETKVIRLFSPKVFYSAAAAVLVLTLGIWIYNQYFHSSVSDDCTTIACANRKDIVKARIETLDEDQLYQTVDVKKLEENLNNNQSDVEKKKSDSISADDLLDEI